MSDPRKDTPTVTCWICNCEVRLRADGTMRKHGFTHPPLGSGREPDDECKGSGTREYIDPLHDLVSLVMDKPPPPSVLLDLLPSEKAEVERWAALEHLAASDNGNERVPMPKCLKRCPHDGGVCHHECERFPGQDKCFRESGNMHLTTPHDGYPVEGHVFPPCVPAERRERQARVGEWVEQTFGLEVMEPDERAARLLEEALELAQAAGVTRAAAHDLACHVYDKPVGEVHQEAGGVGVTLLAFCHSVGMDADQLECIEFDRARRKPRDEMRRRHGAKVAAGVAAPMGPGKG